MQEIYFTGLGGCEEVGRSSFLIDSGDKILLERGMKLTPEETQYPLPVETNLDAVVISHAHLDHSGYLPHLFHESNVLSYMTQPTFDTAKMLWFDTLKIAGLEGMEPEFTEVEIERASKHTFPVNYRRNLDITKNASLELFDAGHIMGSALCKLSFKEKTLLYTGDFKADETRLFNGADLDVGKVDYLVIESTYGDRNHPPRKETEKEFVEAVQDTIDNGGWAMVPAFAVGRSQEIIDILHEYKIDVPIYLDGMGQKAARILLDYPQYLKNAKFLKQALENAIWVKSGSFRRKALKQPSVIVTTAGMLGGGPIVEYLKKRHDHKESSVLLTGYQVEGTEGRRLLETGKIELDGELVDVKCNVKKFDFSAHASQDEMLGVMKKWSPEKVVLVHGDKEVMPIFKQKIESTHGIETVIPQLGKKIKL